MDTFGLPRLTMWGSPVSLGADQPARVYLAAGSLVIVGAWTAMLVHEFVPDHSHGLGSALLGWAVMTVAMMGPLVLPAIGHVADSSLLWRRRRAVGEFLVVYFLLWMTVGVAVLSLTMPLHHSPGILTAGLALAAAWQLTTAKRRAMWACHRSVPLPPVGARATMGCARFGFVHGTACIASCWPVMALMPAVPRPHFLSAAALAVLVLHERRSPKPARAARLSAAFLALAAFASALAA